MREARHSSTGEARTWRARLALAIASAAVGALWLSACVPSQPGSLYRANAWKEADNAFKRAQGKAETCRRPDRPEGSGIFVVVFGTDGIPLEAQIRASALSGTPTAECVLGLLRAERIAPFEGYPAIVHGRVTVGAANLPGPGNVPFDRDATARELYFRANAVAGSCRGEAVGHVSIYFANTGQAVAAVVDEGDADTRAAASCIEQIFLGTRVPAFSGPPVSVGKSFTPHP
jgi:hypothetical protein